MFGYPMGLDVDILDKAISLSEETGDDLIIPHHLHKNRMDMISPWSAVGYEQCRIAREEMEILNPAEALKKSLRDTIEQCYTNIAANMFTQEDFNRWASEKRERKLRIRILTKNGRMPWKIRRKG